MKNPPKSHNEKKMPKKFWLKPVILWQTGSNDGGYVWVI